MPQEEKKAHFSNLFDKHYPRLYGYAFKIVCDRYRSEGLVQETFIKLWENIEDIDHNERSISAFLMVTLKNKIIDSFRKEQVRKKHTDRYAMNKGILDEMELDWQLRERVDSIYDALPEKTAEIFRLSRNKGLSYKEIAEVKGISVKTVELHISKALAAFRKGLKDYL